MGYNTNIYNVINEIVINTTWTEKPQNKHKQKGKPQCNSHVSNVTMKVSLAPPADTKVIMNRLWKCHTFGTFCVISMSWYTG